MNSQAGLPVLIVNYFVVPYTPSKELQLMMQAMYMWSRWFPDYFIILGGVDTDND